MSVRMKGAGRVGWFADPSTRAAPSNVTRPVAVAGRSLRLLPGPFTVDTTEPTPVQVTSTETSWSTPPMSRTVPDPVT